MSSDMLSLHGWFDTHSSNTDHGLQYHWLYGAMAFVVLAYVIWGVCIAIYRVTLHPLASIPGPKLAALSYWYEVYFEVFLGGQYFKQIKYMHRKYGPIVRINPDEVHFNDPDFINAIYPTSRRKTDKPQWVGRRSGTPNSIVATTDHDQHRLRRSSINNFFSNASIERIEPDIKRQLQKMIDRWDDISKTDHNVLNMIAVFQAYASDIITTYAFGDCFNFLDDEYWGEQYFSSQENYFRLTHIFGHFPITMKLINNMPACLMSIFIPNLSEILEKQKWWLNRVRQIRNSPNPDEIKRTIFQGILSSKLPENEKTDMRMAHDAQLIALAGESTTGYTLSAILFELLSHPHVYKRARTEVLSAVADDQTVVTYAQVQNLPFLNAVMQEGLRLHPGVMSRMARISPEKDLIYHDQRRGSTYVVPAGTPASMTTFIMHTDPETFTDPYSFLPQRWIDNPELSQAIIAFSRGSRNCVGQDFARREMLMMIATILRRYELYCGQDGPTLELYETIRDRDIVANSEMIIPMPAKGSHGLRVRVRS